MKRIATFVLLFCLIQLLAAAATTTVQASQQPFTIGTQTAQSMDVQFNVPAFEIEEESVGGAVYHKIKLTDSGYLTDAGMPELPTMSTMIAIPNHGSVQVELINAHTKMIEHILPYPSQGGNTEATNRNLIINPACYQGNQIFPQEVIRYSEPQIMRDFRIITLQVQPFAWDSATGELIVRDQVTFRVRFTDEPGINELNQTRNISASFDKIYAANILNYRDFRPDNVLPTPEKIVIIYGNYTDTTFQTKLNTFALWKKQKGADVRVVSTSVAGTSNAAIKTYLQGLYNDPATRPDYIVLVGDTSGSFAVPTWATNGSGDYPYQMLAGNDQLGDCFMGRISAETTAQLDVIFAKVYAYEKTINVPTAQWLNRMLLVGDPAHSGRSVVYNQHYVRELALNFNPDYTFTMLTNSGPSTAAMDQALNQGVGFFNYRGYIGMSGWSPGGGLVNGVKLPHAVIITCATGSFAGQTSTTEAFIRLGTAATPSGALTAIGMDTAGTHTMPNNVLTGAIFDGIFAHQMRSMGEALLSSKLYMSRMFGATQPDMANTFNQWCNLMGDPTAEVYITIPHTFNANIPTNMPLGSSLADFIVTDQDGIPVEDACVTVTQTNTIIGRTYTNADGEAYIALSTPLISGDAIITVSKHDYKPLQQTVPVSANGYLVTGMSMLDDDAIGNSQGNGDFNANAGETLEVLFSLRNTTTATISNLSGYVSCQSEYATVTDSLITFASIDPGANQFNAVPIIVQIQAATPNNTLLHFNIHLTDSALQTYDVPEFISVTDANLGFVSSMIVDGANNVIDPGETATLNVTINNTGSVLAGNIFGELFSDNDLVTVEDSTGYFGNVTVNGTASTLADNFIIHGRNLLLPGMIIPMRIKLTNPAGFLQWVSFNLTVGNVTLHDPMGPDAYGYIIYDDTDTGYTECPVYEWVGIAPAEGGSGTALAINDAEAGGEGDSVDAVSVATVTLPFPFTFYGEAYTQITVCSNGFIAMGASQNGEFRNYRLPGAMGPSPMIAPFWDDLAMAAGSGIYTWNDAANHRFIVEWYHLVNGYQNSAQETFQVILHDPAFYATSLGDGPIKIQYNTFNNVDAGTGLQNHGNYSSIGIENGQQNVGLEYSFNNTYPTAASPLGNGRALYITNVPVYYENAYLVMGETVVSDSNGNSVVEPGENVELGVQLLNIGSNQATGINATITTNDPMVTITNNASAYYPIAGDGVGINQTAFTFTVSPNCPADHSISFNMDIVTDTNAWQRNFNVTVQKSELVYESFFLNDISGNNSGIADPNESFLLIVNVKNNSDVDAQNLLGTLTTTNTAATITDAIQAKYVVSPDDITQFVYPVTFGAIPSNSYVPFSFSVIADNAAAATGNFTVGCGTSGVNQDFENNDGGFINVSGWAWGVPSQTQAHSGQKVWATGLTGEYPNGANYSMKTPPITIGANSTLSFWHKLGCESGWDGGNVSVSTNGGSSWTVIPPATGGTYIANITALNEPGFSAGPASWTEVTFDLNQFANNEIIIRWHFGSDTSVTGIGWFIDDVMITGFAIKSGIVSGTVALSTEADPAFAKVSSHNHYITNPNSTGAYALYLPTGTYTATASMPYYQSVTSPSFTLTDQNLTTTQDFTLIYLPAPMDLSVTGQQGQSEVVCTWSAPENPIYPVVAYKVYRRMGPGSFAVVGQPTTNSFTDNLTLQGHYAYYVTPMYSVGEGAPSETVTFDFPIVGTEDPSNAVLVNALKGNYPNPFNPTTTLSYSVAKAGMVNLKVYNTKGQLVKTLVSAHQLAGKHTIVWDGTNDAGNLAASGLYLYRLETGKYSSTKKMMMMK